MRQTLLLAAALCLPGAALAQGSANLDRASRNPTAPAKTVAESSAASAASVAASSVAAEIPFSEILNRPDDVGLNERYALQRIRAGDLRGAATTLERVLLVDPTRYRTRLLYGVVLVRLDDVADAALELDRVLATPALPRETRDEAEAYERLVRSRRRLSHFDARLTLGLGFDDNRNAAPNSGTRLIQGTPFQLTDDSRRKADSNLQFVGSLGASRQVWGATGDQVFARFTYYRAEQKVYDLLNLQAYSPKAGAVLRTRWADVTPSLSFDHVLLSQSSYLRSRNADLRVERRLSDRWSAWFEFGHSYQDFLDTPRVAGASGRTGDQLDWTLGTAWSPDPLDRLTLTALHRRKYAQDVAAYAYRRESVGAQWLRLLGRGRFATLGVTGQFDRYEIPDPSVEPGVVRHDDAVVVDLLYGQPLDLLWSRLRNLEASVGYEYFYEGSTVVNYEYSNNKATAFVTYKWGI
ncbi:MAG: hypothetical protein KGM24_00775 [Elusimicrobia bacterium]|nr:hypothetical protein [Elusimicrobiota bacterium]